MLHVNTSAAFVVSGDGKVKYKVVFEEVGKCLVSSHHIALVTLPQLDYLFVGARVVVKSTSEQADFKPGILAEVPSRKNRMRCVGISKQKQTLHV